MESRLAETKMDNEYRPVLVLGRIGAGKSTLINYLLGKKIVRAKKSGLFKMDVTDGEAKPVIYHDAFGSGTKELGEFKDEVKKISYYDTPPIKISKNEALFDKDAPKTDKNMSDISQLIDQIKEKKGFVIIVCSMGELDSPYHGFVPQLNLLCQKTKIVDCHLLFAATKTEEFRDDLTDSDVKDRAMALLSLYENPPVISKKMEDVHNWIAVNMLTPESRQTIHQWIEKVAPRKISTFTENLPTASESAKNPHTPKVFKPAPLVIASVEVSPHTQKQTAERSSPTNGR